MNYPLSIKNNLIIYNKSIIAVYELDPVDLFILPESDQEIFIKDMRNTLNSIKDSEIQIIMRTRNALPEDLNTHFNTFNKFEEDMTINKTLIQKYSEDLTELISKNIIPIKEYFLLIKQNCEVSKSEQLTKGINSLERKVSRIFNNINATGIGLKQITGKDLDKFLITFTRS